MKISFAIITVTMCFFITGCLTSSNDGLTKFVDNLKDDCGNICGILNVNINDNKCGDSDKRNDKYLIFNDPNDKTEEKTEYFDILDRECGKKCPDGIKQHTIDGKVICSNNLDQLLLDFKNANIIKVDQGIKNSINEQNDNSDIEKKHQDDIFRYTWWIVGGIGILVVILTSTIMGIVLKKKATTGNADLEQPEQEPEPETSSARPPIKL